MTAMPPEESRSLSAEFHRASPCHTTARPFIHIYIDVENVAGWVNAESPESLVRRLSRFGEIATRRAFADWKLYFRSQRALSLCGFDLHQVFHLRDGKDAADMELATRAMFDACHAQPGDTFVVVSSDADFLPLYRQLGRLGMNVLVIGRTEAIIRRACENSGFSFSDLEEFRPNSKARTSTKSSSGARRAPAPGAASGASVDSKPNEPTKLETRYKEIAGTLGLLGLIPEDYLDGLAALRANFDGAFRRSAAVRIVEAHTQFSIADKEASRIVHALQHAGCLKVVTSELLGGIKEGVLRVAAPAKRESILRMLDANLVHALKSGAAEWCRDTAEQFMLGEVDDDYLDSLERNAELRQRRKSAFGNKE